MSNSSFAMRNQLLSGDIGNIDVTQETPINYRPVVTAETQKSQQYQQFQRLPEQKIYHQQHQQYQQMQYAPNVAIPGYPPQLPMASFAQPPTSRRGSNDSGRTSFSVGNVFNKFGKSKKSGFGGGRGDDGDDDDDKDVFITEAMGNSMTFNDITTIKDRGRYGGQSTYESAPIIPTLGGVDSLPNGNVSSTQYRKQMTAMKKRAMVQASQLNKDPRTMSLQGTDPRTMSLQGANAGYIPDTYTPPSTDPRAMSLQTGGSNPYLNGYRTQNFVSPQESIIQQNNGLRANSFAGSQNPYAASPRAYSLTTASSQQRQGFSQSIPPNPRAVGGTAGLHAPQSVREPVRYTLPNQAPQFQRQASPHDKQFQQKRFHNKTNLETATGHEQNQPRSHLNTHQNNRLEPGDDINHHILGGKTIKLGSQSGEQSTASATLDKSPETEKYRSDHLSSAIPKSLPHLSILNLRDDEDAGLESSKDILIQQTDLESKSLNQRMKEYTPHVLNTVEESATSLGYVSSERSTTPPQNAAGSSRSSFFSSPRRSQMSPFKQTSPSSFKHSDFHRVPKASISSMSDFSAVSSENNDYTSSENNRRLYQLAKDQDPNNDIFVTASQFSILDKDLINDTDNVNDQTLKNESIHEEDCESVTNKTPKVYHRLGDAGNSPVETITEADNKTPKIGATLTGKPKNYKSPKFLQNWSKRRSEKKLNNSFETVTEPIPIDESHDILQGGFVDSNDGFIEATDIPKMETLNKNTITDSFKNSLENEGLQGKYNDALQKSQIRSTTTPKQFESSNFSRENANGFKENSSSILNDSFKPLESKTGSDDKLLVSSTESGRNIKKLNLTVDQLGIMEEKSSIIQELELVSKELAASIRREITLEDKLKGKERISSPKINYGRELRDKGSEIYKLVEELNQERKKRFISEQHVLLLENGVKPSALELDYELDKLRSQIVIKDELINNQTREIETLKNETPLLQRQVEELGSLKENLENSVVPELQSEIEFLKIDAQKLSLLTERYKLLRLENEELQRKLKDNSTNHENNNYFVSAEGSSARALNDSFNDQSALRTFEIGKSTASSPSRRIDLSSPNSKNENAVNCSGINNSDSNGKRIASFNLINVTSSE